MKILVIGGTIFLGRHIVDSLLENGHEVWLFNRGKHNPELFGEKVKTVIGDRENLEDLKLLTGEQFDSIIDTCAYFPETVEKSLKVFRNNSNQYVFISTVSVYRDEKSIGIKEDYPLAKLQENTDLSKITHENYGPLKARCEKMVLSYFPKNSLIIRPGYIIGPYDLFDRFNCWISYAYNKLPLLCPGDGEDKIQFIDVRDLADWIVKSIFAEINGIFNACGESKKFIDFIQACKDSAGSKQPIIHIPVDYISENNLFSELAIYCPNSGDYLGYCQTDNNKAKNQSLIFREYSKTFKDIYQLHLSRGKDYIMNAGLSDEKYRKILDDLEKIKTKS